MQRAGVHFGPQPGAYQASLGLQPEHFVTPLGLLGFNPQLAGASGNLLVGGGGVSRMNVAG